MRQGDRTKTGDDVGMTKNQIKALHRDKRKIYPLPYKVANGCSQTVCINASQVDQTRPPERMGAARSTTK
jgi:hypothetical protein